MTATLRRYARAFGHRDVGALQSTFADTIRRRGAGPGGCVTSIGKPAVISDFSGQFAPGRPRYTIGGLKAVGVRLEKDIAAAKLELRRRSSSRSTPIRFRLTRNSGAWLIDRIASGCRRGTSPVPRPPGGKKAPASGGPRVVHPRPGCMVLLSPQKPGSSSPRKPPDQKALERLCAAGRR